jgi:lysophospholipase L1-like esterase
MNTKKITGLALTICILTLIGFAATKACAAGTADSNAAAPVSPGGKMVKFVLMGDSTVSDRQGWGPGFRQSLNDKASCVNTAVGGRSSKSFINEGRLKKAIAMKGDYYLIQFGHNDEPNKDPNRDEQRATNPNTTYREYMTQYINEVRAIGAKPILVTPMVRRQWDKSDPNKINSTLTPYAEAVRALAKEKNVPLVDLYASSKKLCEQLGKEKCYEFSPMKENNQYDNTHLNDKGSVMFARLVVEDLIKAVPELKPLFRSEPVADANAAAKP